MQITQPFLKMSLLFVISTWTFACSSGGTQLSNQPTAQNVEPDIVTSTGSGRFRPGNFRPKILSATRRCRLVALGKMKSDGEEISGYWNHPETRGKLVITSKNKIFKVKFTGPYVIDNLERVQTKGKSLLIEARLKHDYGSCSISFIVPEVLI